MNVLLIEPDHLLAASYRAALQQDGHQVTVRSGAQSAVMAADEQTPDIIVLEVQLVGHSGLEFLYEFRSYPEWQDIPVIILSHVPAGEFAGSWQLLRKQLGVQAYHYKPLTSLRRLQQAVGQFANLET